MLVSKEIREGRELGYEGSCQIGLPPKDLVMVSEEQ